MASNNLRIGPGAWLALVTAGLAIWLAITYSWLIVEVLGVVFGAFLLSLSMRPLADFLARWRIPRGMTVVGLYVVAVGLLVLFGRLTVPAIADEVIQLRNRGPELLAAATARLETVPLLSQLAPSLDALVENVGQWVQTLAGALLDAAASVGKLFVDIALVFLLAIFFTADERTTSRLLTGWVPSRYQRQARATFASVSMRLSRWVWAQVGIAFFIAVFYGGGLALIGVPFGITIGVVSGALAIVPYLGSTTALIAGCLSALIVGPRLLIWVLLLHIVIQAAEGYLLQPLLYGRAVDVHPAAILIALLVGGSAGGVLGVLFAVPVVVVIAAIYKELQPALPPEPPQEDTTPSPPPE